MVLGAPVREGETLAFISDAFGEQEDEVTSPCDGVVIGRTNLPLVYEGDALFHIARVDGKRAQQALEAFTPEEEYERGLTAELADDPLLT